MMTMPALRDAPRLVLLLKSGPGSGAKIAHQSGYAFYGSPARWHKITVEKPAPKGAPVASHPEAAGKHAPAEHLAATEWQSLQLPETNVNAPSYNKALAKLKEWSDAGNVTAIVGAGYGSNTYGQKLAKIANHLLALHGSPHKVTAGQKAGTHAATMGAEPAKAAPLPDLDSPEDMAANHGPAAAKPPKLHTSGISSFMVMDGHNVKIAAVDQKEGGGYALFIDDEYKGHFSNAGSAQAEAHQTIYASDEPAPAGEYGIKSAKQGNLGAEGSVHTVYAPDFSGIEAALGLEPGDLSDTDSTTYVVTNHKGQTFHVYKHGGALSVRVAGANQDHASAAELADWLKGKAQASGPKEGDTKPGADGGTLVLKDGHWVKMDTGDDGAGDWAYNAEDPGMSGAPTIGNHEGLVAYLPGQGAEFHTDESMMANTGEPALQAENLQGLVQKMAAAGYQVPPLAMLKKLDPSFKMPAGAKAKAVSPAAPAVEPMDSWVQTGGQGGSNPGGKFKDASGQEWYVKWPDDAEAVKSEILAAKLYALAGLSSQDAKLVTKGGKTAIATKWVNIKKAGSAAALAKVDGVHSGFAVDAWLGNWDVVGLSLDNLQIGPDGKAHRVDAGGSLEYRAQGEKKPFGASVDEIDTLRDAKKNAKAAAVFGKMTKADIAASVAKVAAIEDSAIRAMVFEHGPGDDAAKKKLADTLIARKEDLLKRYPEAAKPKKKPLDPKALPVDPKSLPKPHDFENWNGPGKGLSSKDFVNKANAVAEYQMLALAQAGNMVALRDYKFQEVDKNTGAPTGKMLPVSQHPSKHVLQFQQDLLQVLEEVANPPEPLKVFRATEVGSLAALNAAFPPKKFGTTVSKVASNEKLGFWVALGAVGNPSKFKPKKVSNYTAAAIEAAKAKYQKASQLAKHFISSVQASGSYNDLFRDGKTHDHQGNSLKDVAKAALEHATEMPEGTSVYRWQKMSPQMLEHIMSAKEGTVFQATGPMCTSYSPTATKGFGTHRVTIRYAKGAKAVESFASGGFASEKEVTTLPNARFVILSKEMVPDVEHGNPSSKRLELEILMLPPDLGI